ncbi:MAG: hypothetical protein KGI80_00510 [Verrucomicrobiota bacterium]|nr:hypothetical protein [Verrucomicrobiota bacterium]
MSLGIHVDIPFQRVALVQKRAGTPLLVRCGSLEEMSPFISGRVVSGLSSEDLLVRPVTLKAVKRRHLHQALAFQAENDPLLPEDEFLSVHYVKQRDKKETRAYLCTLSRKALHLHLDHLKTYKIDPDVVSCNDLALLHYVRWKIPPLKDAFIVHLGSKEWTGIWMEKGELQKSYCIPGGIQLLLSALQEDRKKNLPAQELESVAKQIDLLQLKTNLNPKLNQQLHLLRQELAKTLFSFHRASGERPLLFTGLIDSFGRIREFLSFPCQEIIVNQHPLFAPAPEEEPFAIAIGLALQQMEQPLQLRREEFFPKKNWRKAGLISIFLLLTSLLCTAALLSYGHLLLKERLDKLTLETARQNARLDPAIQQELFRSGPVTPQRWIAKFSSAHSESPYIVRAPKVTEFFCWLCNHPVFLEAKKEGEPFEILSLNYQMEECPKMDDLSAAYLAKVEINFSASNNMYARKFHEALLKEESMIDLSSELEWETATDDTYHVSFSLQNYRTPHVP